MFRPHWPIHNASERKKPAQNLVPHNDLTATGWFEMAQIPNKTDAGGADISKKLGLLVTYFHSELCLIAITNLWLNLPRFVKTTMASKGNQLQLLIFSPTQSSSESIKILEISSAHLTCSTQLSVIHGPEF